MYIIVQNMKPYRRYELFFFKWHFSTDIWKERGRVTLSSTTLYWVVFKPLNLWICYKDKVINWTMFGKHDVFSFSEFFGYYFRVWIWTLKAVFFFFGFFLGNFWHHRVCNVIRNIIFCINGFAAFHELTCLFFLVEQYLLSINIM